MENIGLIEMCAQNAFHKPFQIDIEVCTKCIPSLSKHNGKCILNNQHAVYTINIARKKKTTEKGVLCSQTWNYKSHTAYSLVVLATWPVLHTLPEEVMLNVGEGYCAKLK